MKQRHENKFHLPVKTIMVFAAILSIIAISAFAFKDNNDIAINKATFRDPEKEKDSVESVHGIHAGLYCIDASKMHELPPCRRQAFAG
jgi:hypothetical protein